MTMIERIARAINPDAFTECSLRTIEHRTNYDTMRAKARRQAQAALEAIALEASESFAVEAQYAELWLKAAIAER